MKLGSKILLTTASIFLGLTIVLFLLSRNILLGSFERLEREDAVRNVERVLSALAEKIGGLSSLDLDWASWDDSFFFVKDRNEDFIRSNLNNETLAKQKLCLIVFLDAGGGVVYAKALDHHTTEEVPVPDDIRPFLSPGSPFIGHKNPDSKMDGVISLKKGFLLASSRPILNSEGKGPIGGALVMARYLDGEEVKSLSETTHLTVSLLKYEQGIVEKINGNGEVLHTDEGSIMLRPATDDIIEGYGIVNDIYGNPAFLIRVDLPRGIFKQGKASLSYFITYLLAAAAVSAGMITLLFKKHVLSRLLNLGNRVSGIGLTGDLSERVAVSGRDELSALSGDINRMLTSLQSFDMERKNAEERLRKANDELDMKVKERTSELLEINVELKEEIAERERIEDAMKEMVYHDYLTGLPNRLLFTDRLNQVIAMRARHNHTMAAVIFMDMDRFKIINDSLGHLAGDELIKTVAAMMRKSLRESDTVARIGGDEFTILIPDLTRIEDVPVIVEKMFGILRNPISLMGQDVFITASFGVSVFPYDGTDSVMLLKNADIAMYHAKSKGGNTYEMYNPEMAKKAFEKLTIGNKLRTAMELNEFRVYYQPLYDMRTGVITGSEALIRWQDPELGLISPASFIPIAEETGIIVPVGDWVMRTACALDKGMQEEGFPGLSVSVNISARMFTEPDFAQKVERALSETGLSPEHLNLELTESILMANLYDAGRIVKDLKKTGVKFSIDDFGTGYSSLAYLKNLSIDHLKIDRSFIKDITIDKDDRLIVKAIINLAHSMDLEVVAEGVETQEQLDFLMEHRCDLIQGYLFSRPLPEKDFISLLKKREKKPVLKSA